MMEKRKRYRIADAEIEIAFTENYTEIICRDYEVKAEGKPDFVIEVTDEEVEREKKKSEPGASKGIIESLAIYRKLCEKILDRNCVLFHCSAVAVDGNSILVYGCKRNRKIHAYKDVETAFRRQGSDG